MNQVTISLKKAKSKTLSLNNLKTVTNPNSIHGIYPYRGKISALDASSVVSQLKPGLLLDPFCGSGTILYEANKHGLDAIGVDSNPLAFWISKGKIGSLKNSLNEYLNEVEDIIKSRKSMKESKNEKPLLEKAFHPETLAEIKSIINHVDDMSDYVKACFFGATALTARGCNQYKWTSSTVGKDIQPKQYINFFEKFRAKVKKHIYDIDSNLETEIHLNDSRKLSDLIPEKSIDYVFTSPPYFDALDYTAYYGQIIYELLDIERGVIKSQLIQKVTDYEEGMRKVLEELNRVTKDDALIIFVVGDKKVKGGVINGGEFFSKLLHHKPNKVIERKYTGSSSQIFDKLNKTERKEQIVIWDKSTWK